MKHALTLVLLLLTVPSWAQAPAGFQTALVASVLTASLEFMAPRTLEPIPVSQLALWGLRGITSIDAGLTIEERGAVLELRQANRSVLQRPLPGTTSATEAAQAWGNLGADLMAAAWTASDVMRDAGMQAMVSSFFDELFNHLDPYSRYVPPGAADVDRAKRSGEAGAGLTVVRTGAGFVIGSVNASGAGAEAGIVAGDRILAVDDQPTRGETLATVLGWIAGEEGTDVSITLRNRAGAVRTVEVERVVSPPETVFVQRLGDLAVIRISSFSRDTDQRLTREFERLAIGRKPRGVVIDLRGNRGGLLRQAVSAIDLLLDGGPIATTAGRNPNASHEWRAGKGDAAAGLPIVVLVDGRSASAAEIIAAALADGGRAVVVGSSTLGKGLVQTIANLPDGGELFVTWSRVLAPRGWPIQGLGVLPQVCTSQGQEALAQQLASLDRGTSRLADALDRHRAARAPLPNAEIVDLRTACPAAEGRDADMATARYLVDHPVAYATARLPAPALTATRP